MKKQFLVRLVALVACMGILATFGYQPVATAQAILSAQSAAGAPTALRGLDVSVVISATGVPVKTVIQDLAEQASLKVTFGDAVARDQRVVTFHNLRGSAREVLAKVLQGSGITYSVMPSGGLLFDRVARSGRKVAVGVITGRVTDVKTGKPVAGASVALGAVSDRGVTTGEDGGYRLTGVGNGTHIVTVRTIGYAKQSRSVTVADGATVQADFKLEPSASVLDQVVVTGTVASTERKAIPNAMTVVTAKDIEEKGITSIEQLFRGEIPGILALNNPIGSSNVIGRTQMFSRGISSRGSNISIAADPSPIKTYADGVELADPGFLNTIDPKSIERIEFITGPQASTIYGSGAINGVMQVFTKKASGAGKPQLSVSLQSGIVQNSFSNGLTPQHNHSAQVTGGGQETSYNIGGGYASLGEWDLGVHPRTLSGYGGIQRTDGLVKTDVSARMFKRDNASSFCNMCTVYTPRINTGELAYQRSFMIGEPSSITVDGRTLGLVFSANILPFWQNRFTIGTDETKTEWIGTTPSFAGPADTAYGVNTADFKKQTLQYSTTISHEVGNIFNSTLTAGVDYMSYQNHTLGIFQAVQTTGTITSIFNPSIQRTKETNKGYFAQGQVGVRDMLFFTAGLRREDNTNYGKNYTGGFSPRYGVSLVEEVGNLTTKLRASYGVATRTPVPGQGDAVFGRSAFFPSGYLTQKENLGLQPERQKGPEYGVELYMGDIASLQVTKYNQTVDHLISSVTIDSTASVFPDAIVDCGTPKSDGFCYQTLTQWQNVGSLGNRGWEAQGDIHIGRHLSLGGTWSYTRSRLQQLAPGYRCTSTFLYQCLFSGSSLSNFAEHTGALRAVWRGSQTTVSVLSSHIGQRTFNYNQDFGIQALLGRIKTYVPQYNPRLMPDTKPGYQKMDAQVAHRVKKSLEIYIRFENVFDKYENDRDGSFGPPTLGRSSNFGVRWSL